jgi:hypothetical protein
VSATFESVASPNPFNSAWNWACSSLTEFYGPGQIGNVDLQGLGWLQSIGHFSQMRSHGFGELNYLRVQCSHWRERFSKYARFVTKGPHRLERARKLLYMVMKTRKRLAKLERQSAQLAERKARRSGPPR